MQAWHVWAVLAMAFALLELLGAHFVLLGMALAAALVAGICGFAPQIGVGDQIVIFSVASILIVPAIIVAHRRFYPAQDVSVMNEPLSKASEPREVVVRNGRIGVEIYGDFYPARFSSGLLPDPGMQVVVTRFEGITAIVRAVSDPFDQGA